MQLKASERRAIAAASIVIATGETTRAFLVSDGVPATQIAVVEPRHPIVRRWLVVLVPGRRNYSALATLNQR